jgi:uncharacterized protein YbjT (DUF2867 family)
MARRVVTVFGASGFIGRQVVRRFAAQGWVVRAAMRDPIAGEVLKPMGDPGQIILMRADITQADVVRAAVTGADVVINLVGILLEKGRATFDAIHHQGAANVAQAARDAGVGALVHMSALGADKASDSAYARSKAQGEEAVLAAFPTAAIVRPSVVFGPDDDFFNRFGRLARILPVLPVFTNDGFKAICSEDGCRVDWFGSGGPTLQPVYVGDVAEAILRAATTPSLFGQIFELGGPRRYSLKDIMDLVMAQTKRQRLLIPLPFCAARFQAALFSLLPNPPITADQVKLLQVDNVVSGNLPTLSNMGITPTATEAILPKYMHRYSE